MDDIQYDDKIESFLILETDLDLQPVYHQNLLMQQWHICI
jgi:hypothetical protein